MEEQTTDADVIIVGAGPAGLSSASWCVELGLRTILFEKEAEAGGQLLSIFHPITNYLGLETSNGREMRDIFVRSVNQRKPLIRFSEAVVEIDPLAKAVITGAGKRVAASAVIIATGVRRRRLNVPGEEIFIGKGIIESGSNEKETARDKTVIIAGGGDAALENALILAEFALKVYVAHRRSELSARAEFTEVAARHPKIEFLFDTVIESVNGGANVETVALKNVKSGNIAVLPAEIVLARIGVEPNTGMLQGIVQLDANGYININNSCETNVRGIFAVGDAANPISPTINSAAGMGSTAAKAAFILLAQEKAV